MKSFQILIYLKRILKNVAWHGFKTALLHKIKNTCLLKKIFLTKLSQVELSIQKAFCYVGLFYSYKRIKKELMGNNSVNIMLQGRWLCKQ